ncbi:MAG TPA: PEP/pyruvate-binding domain-containing protein [Ktedonobacteraceae bacterium]
MSLQHQQQERSEHLEDTAFVLPFSALDRDSLALAGGKGANLGEMTIAGFPVPPGFCITTTAYEHAAAGAGLEETLTALAGTSAGDSARLAALAQAARDSILRSPIPPEIAESICAAYQSLGNGETPAVSVRSSATAEDLPYASFAGQQETYLNVVGSEAVLDAVRRCWASLWTDRAVSYRATQGIDHRTVQLAVVVQRMVEAAVAGVLFTANPLTGRRRQAVIDANPGLGEAVVSGATNPDHFVITTATGEIVERHLGDKRVIIKGNPGGGTVRTESLDGGDSACLSDDQVRALVTLGARVEAHYAAPQDIEWAIDPSGKVWLLQTRPITTLFPLPVTAPATDDVLRVYFSINVVQGVYGPFTPMGRSAFPLFASALATAFGLPPRDPLSGPGVVVEAASRLFLDVTTPLRSSFGRKFLIGAARVGETLSAGLFEQLTADPRLSLVPSRRWPVVRAFGSFIARTRIPLYLLQALFWPSAAVARVERMRAGLQEFDAEVAKTGAVGSIERLTALEQLLFDWMPRIIAVIAAPAFACGLMAYGLAGRLLDGLATPDELQSVLRGLPHNPTTEMDLALWDLARRVQADPATARYLRETPPEQQAQDYRAGSLPLLLQQELSEFLRAYGHRGVAEIDLGLPRWSENPTHILGVLVNYLQLQDPTMAPDVQFRRGAQAAEAMVADLTRRATRKGRLRGLLVGFLLKRARALAGIRETPKFCIVFLLARAREQLWSVGEELQRAGRLEAAEDIFFITLPEAHLALAGKDMRPIVREHRADYEHELHRRHVPRVLLSDGTEPGAASQPLASQAGTLQGTPASPGRVTAPARVILDPTGARLEPGEILVALSTDPGWTPLFLTAAGLVMEMGGMMSHGAVVAREYGIPAVVGVPAATERITTGQQITIDGATGTISIDAP